MGEEYVGYELRDGVAVLTLDDGKANALSPTVITQLEAALERAAGEASALVWIGRPGRFSAGFDLGVMRGGGEGMAALVRAGAELYAHMLTHPKPIVAAATGHALAAGGLALLAADYRVGVRGDFKIGLNEVAIGLTLPNFAVEMARVRLSKRHLARAAGQAEIYAPDGALDAGFLDEVVEDADLLERAVAVAGRLGGLPATAFEETRRRLFGDLAGELARSAAEEFPLPSDA